MMFRYVIALLLINTYYSSLGVPVKNLSVLLSTLEESCGASFVSSQIKSKINDCSSSPQNEIQKIKCLIFYDVNSQLCAAVAASKLVLKDDYSGQLNVDIDVNKLCEEAEDWVFSNISAYSHYKAGAENIFKHQGTCGQVCGTNDLTGNSNDYCKYFKWGLDMLKSLTTSTTTTTTQVSVPVPAEDVSGTNPVGSVVSNDKKESKETNSKDPLDLKVKHDAISPEIKAKETISKPSLENIDEPISGGKVVPGASGLSASTNKQLMNDAPINKVESSSNTNKQQESPLESGDTNANQGVLDKPSSDIVPNVLDSDKNKDPVLDQPNTKEQGDTGLGSDGLDDLHYDGMADDADDGTDTKPEEEEKKDLVVPIMNSGNKLPVDEIESLGSNGGYYASTNQDYSDDDDHFFTFFLITVVMVVLLYVLYHNKNKVSKVFFGLMLEGRQSGRRRNSRGHAYRRLDTLEQAMSGSTAAPPSKIIY